MDVGYQKIRGATMDQNHNFNRNKGFLKIGFSEKVARCVERGRRQDQNFEIANWPTIERLIKQARLSLEIASDDTIRLLLNKNPNLIRTTKCQGVDPTPEGFFAYLPINHDGVEMLMKGQFDGRSPRPEWITEAHEEPAAIYIWLVYLPGSFGRSMGMVANLFDSLTRDCCPVFSRSVNEMSQRLSDGMGFMPADQFYPDCKPGLLVAFPRQEIARPKRPKSAVYIARSVEDIVKVFAVRSATYLAEQFCFFAEEFDGNDFCATHFLGTIDGDPAGCIRMRFFSGFAKIERLAVRSEYRSSKLAYELARAAIKLCHDKGYQRIVGHSRSDLVRFWATFGCKVREDRPEFSFANVMYREIVLDLPPSDAAIDADVDPLVLIRPEGDWHRPGPLDISESENDPRRKQLIETRSRSVRNKSFAKV
jgi:predicted GNAT family N-acyltransferase